MLIYGEQNTYLRVYSLRRAAMKRCAQGESRALVTPTQMEIYDHLLCAGESDARSRIRRSGEPVATRNNKNNPLGIYLEDLMGKFTAVALLGN